MITIDEVKLKRDNYITISIKVDIISHAMMVKKPAKKCAVCTFRDFFFIFITVVVALISQVALPCKTILNI